MANIKLVNNFWETSGIYDKVKQKTQRTINAEIDTALAGKVPTTRKVNNKALSEDITLDAGDIGYSDSSTYADGSTGKEVKSLKAALNDLGLSVVDGKLNITFEE